MKHRLVQKHTVTKGIPTPVRFTINPELNFSYKVYLLAKTHFQNFKTSINFALFEYRCLHMALFDSGEIHTTNIPV